MAYNGSGVWNRLYNWVNDANNGIAITASRMDGEFNDMANNGLSAVLTRDGQGSAKANLPMNGWLHTGVGNATARDSYLAAGQQQDGSLLFAVAGGTADAITAVFSPSIPGLIDGMQLRVRAGAANATTTPTFSPNGIAASIITKQGGQALVAGDIYGAGHELILRCVLATPGWELLNPGTASIVSGIVPLIQGGTNAALTASNGGIFYSTATAGAILAGTSTAGQILRSGATGAPSWSTATYPATAGTAANVLRSNGTNFLSAALAAADLSNGVSGSGAVVLTAGGAVSALTNLGIRSTGSGAFDLAIANTENLTAKRTLTIALGDANRSFTLGGSFNTLGSFFTGSTFSTTGPFITGGAFTQTGIGGITIAGGALLTTLDVTSGATYTFPSSTSTLAQLGANTFTGTQTFADSGTWGSGGISGTTLGGENLNAGSSLATAGSTISTTTLANIPGLSANLVTGHTYGFEIDLLIVPATSSGYKFTMGGGSATPSSFDGVGTGINPSQAGTVNSVESGTFRSTYTSTVAAFTSTGTNAVLVRIVGTFVCNGSGTLIPQWANNASTGTMTLSSGYMNVWRIL